MKKILILIILSHNLRSLVNYDKVNRFEKLKKRELDEEDYIMEEIMEENEKLTIK